METKKYEFNESQLKWLKALRSGEYTQGVHHLCDDGKYCCLGVACEVLKDDLRLNVDFKVTDYDYKREEVVDPHSKYYEGRDEELPDEVISELKLKGSLGEFGDSLRNTSEQYTPMTSGYGCLSDLNDSNKYTFSEIADFIENNPHIVFKN